MDEYYDPMTITPPTRNDALRLGTLLRRYARGGVLLAAGGMKAGLKAGKYAMPTEAFKERILKPRTAKTEIVKQDKSPFEFNLAEKIASLPQPTMPDPSLRPTFNPDRYSRSFRPSEILKDRQRDIQYIRQFGGIKDPAEFNRRINAITDSSSIGELRSNIMAGEHRLSGSSHWSPTRLLEQEAITGTYFGDPTTRFDTEKQYTRKMALDLYRSIEGNSTSVNSIDTRRAYYDALVERGLLVRNSSYANGVSYRDGSLYDPTHTPLEDFLITDGIVDIGGEYFLNGASYPMNSGWANPMSPTHQPYYETMQPGEWLW